ncbi:hypothetical protein [Patulibacter sp.]|uniref:hypothetical protein n=1 Tax=Patulibacter sp. TaxID=1912859 RepID=UPI002717858A|nr:hypothetical protein [Patulibacter sp.]MDO9409686.1 hypothetical protein [Patulibacter sp.]
MRETPKPTTIPYEPWRAEVAASVDADGISTDPAVRLAGPRGLAALEAARLRDGAAAREAARKAQAEHNDALYKRATAPAWTPGVNR